MLNVIKLTGVLPLVFQFGVVLLDVLEGEFFYVSISNVGDYISIFHVLKLKQEG